ncbi:MAG: plasmid partitioning protein RepB C-terminal domain-containing protein [Acidobacteriaceae bacterium]
MNQNHIIEIPISEIFIANPRLRDKLTFDKIVSNIDQVGLKKPITISKRKVPTDGKQYDLVCGQGRIEAFLALGETKIPAIIVDAPKEERFLMSLVENIARRPPGENDIVREIRTLRDRKYSSREIAVKLGLHFTYICEIIRLLEHGELDLIRAVEAGRIPITVAATIAKGDSDEIQRVLAAGYESGEIRGEKLLRVRRIISQRYTKVRRTQSGKQSQRKLSVDSLVREYQRHTQQQRDLITRARAVHERFLVLRTGMKTLLADEDFATLLRAENLHILPEILNTSAK